MPDPDFRALLAELMEWADKTSAHYYVKPDLFVRVRAALAQPAPEPLTLDGVFDLCEDHGFELSNPEESAGILLEMFREALDRWGQGNG